MLLWELVSSAWRVVLVVVLVLLLRLHLHVVERCRT